MTAAVLLVGVTGFSAGLWLACASRGATSRLRYPAPKSLALRAFSHLTAVGASNPV